MHSCNMLWGTNKMKMMNKFYLLFFISMITYNSYCQESNRLKSLEYTFELSENKYEINVSLIYQNSIVGDTTKFKIPTNFNRNTLDTFVIARDISLNSKGELKKDDFETYLYIGGENSIEISYTIPYFSENNQYLTCKDNDYFLPVVNNDFFHFYSDMSLILPSSENNNNELFEVSVTWLNFSEEWEIANDFGILKRKSGENKQKLKDITIGDLGQVLFFGGNYRKATFEVQGINFHTFIYGKYNFSDSEVITLLNKVATSNMDLWKTFTHNNDYVISLTQKGNDCGKIGGRNMYNSFAIYMSGKFSEEQLPLVFNKAFTHEFTHTWIGTNFISNNEDWEKMRWFVEGFCEYYATLINVKAGILPSSKFKVLINQNYLKYRTSPYVNSSLDYCAENYLYSNSLEKIAYTKGASFAFYLDGYIRKKSNLKYNGTDLMVALLNSQKQINGKLDIASLSKITQDSIEIDIFDLLEKFINNGEVFSLESPLVDTYYTETYPSLDYGFDFIKSANQEIICDVKKDSNAYINGLRNGQKLLSIKGMSSNPSEPIQLEVENNEGKIIIEYLPKGEDLQITLIKNLLSIE